LATGRTACSGINVQNLPREDSVTDGVSKIRGCFVPRPGRVFIDADYGQIELVAFAYSCREQFGYGDTLARLINGGQDIHKLLAAAVLGKPTNEITAAERKAVKAISFGRPGGMGPRRLQHVAKAAYGIDLDEAAVQERIDAYHRLCPELDCFLADETDSGQRLAELLNMTPAAYHRACLSWNSTALDHRPAGWLGGMLGKVLGDPAPVTASGRPYSAEELTYFWDAARPLAEHFKPKLAAKLACREADPALKRAARDWAGRRPVFTATGRLRANATFCASRNTIFQGLSADGAILGLWKVWRAGYTIVDFVHDQVVVEVENGGRVYEDVAALEKLMTAGMKEVIPDMRVRVESVVTRSLDKSDVAELTGVCPADGSPVRLPSAA
jgi:hypothetical protein